MLNNSLQDLTKIILPIRKMEHVDFLRDLFDGTRDKPIRIHRKHFIGRFIFSLRSPSKIPKPTVIPQGMIPVEIELPETHLSKSDRHFFHFTQEHIEQINDFISAAFDLYFHIYFIDTSDLEKLDQEDELRTATITREILVDSFIFGLDMVDYARANETIKKREYRKQMKELELKRWKFLKKERTFRKNIYLKRRKNLKFMILQ